jgi:hypothetical protein
MTSRPDRLAELRTLIEALCEESTSPEQVARLEEILRSDPEAGEFYINYILIQSKLLQEFGGTSTTPANCVKVPGPVGGPTGGVVMRRPTWALAAAGCAIALLVGGFAARRWSKVVPPLPRPAHAAGQGRGPLAGDDRPRSVAVASLVEARGVVWAEGQEPIAVGARLGPRDIRCASGTVKLVFDAGALVALEGPADLRILSGMRIRAVRGRVTARVDEGAKGFAIETPSTVVVDQGTEFGVEVDAAGQTGVVVFEGRVDLARPETAAGPAPIRRLSQGEAMRVGRSGSLSRIVAVGRRPGADEWTTGPSTDRDAVIRSVRDNIRGLESSKYYQVARRGLDDDAPAYVDRSHEWNGLDPSGLPAFLRGADYIMPFNDDKYIKDLQVIVEVARAATLYVLFDDRQQPPAWLSERFTDTGFDIGMDEGAHIGIDKVGPRANSAAMLGRGPALSIDRVFSVWSRDLGSGESISLGAIEMEGTDLKSMYGIAAVGRP